MIFDRIPEYFDDARKEEELFRNILREAKNNSKLVPADFDTEAPLEAIFSKYSPERNRGDFRIRDFRRGPYKEDDFSISLGEDEAMIDYQTGGLAWDTSGETVKYKVNQDNSIIRIHTERRIC